MNSNNLSHGNNEYLENRTTSKKDKIGKRYSVDGIPEILPTKIYVVFNDIELTTIYIIVYKDNLKTILLDNKYKLHIIETDDFNQRIYINGRIIGHLKVYYLYGENTWSFDSTYREMSNKLIEVRGKVDDISYTQCCHITVEDEENEFRVLFRNDHMVAVKNCKNEFKTFNSNIMNSSNFISIKGTLKGIKTTLTSNERDYQLDNKENEFCNNEAILKFDCSNLRLINSKELMNIIPLNKYVIIPEGFDLRFCIIYRDKNITVLFNDIKRKKLLLLNKDFNQNLIQIDEKIYSIGVYQETNNFNFIMKIYDLDLVKDVTQIPCFIYVNEYYVKVDNEDGTVYKIIYYDKNVTILIDESNNCYDLLSNNFLKGYFVLKNRRLNYKIYKKNINSDRTYESKRDISTEIVVSKKNTLDSKLINDIGSQKVIATKADIFKTEKRNSEHIYKSIKLDDSANINDIGDVIPQKHYFIYINSKIYKLIYKYDDVLVFFSRDKNTLVLTVSQFQMGHYTLQYTENSLEKAEQHLIKIDEIDSLAEDLFNSLDSIL